MESVYFQHIQTTRTLRQRSVILSIGEWCRPDFNRSISTGHSNEFYIGNRVVETIHVYLHFQGARHLDANFIVMVFVAMAFVNSILLYCFVSTRITSILGSISHEVYASSWHSLPVALQKHIVMIVRCGQVERHYVGYHLIDCSMVTFSKVHRALEYVCTYHIIRPIHFLLELFTDPSGGSFLLSAVQAIF